MLMKQVKMFAVFFLLGALLSGCVALAAAGAAGAGVAYLKGELNGTLEASPQEVVDAAQATIEEMGFSVISARASEVDGRVEGRTANDRDITIEVDRQNEGTSDISIRVGTFGDEELSREIYNRIQQRVS